MMTTQRCPTFEALEQQDLQTLEYLARFAELAIAKPYVLDRIKTTIAIKKGL